MSGFKGLFWSFLFFFDFRIQGFDLLPDIIGYCLIYSGVGDLVSQSKHFTAVRKYALLLSIVSLFDIYQIKMPIEQFSIDPVVFFFSLTGILIAIMDLVVIFNLCYGIVEMAGAVGNSKLASVAVVRWRYYLYTKIALIILTSIGVIAPSLLIIVFLPLFIISIGVLALMMGLMKQADDAFNTNSI